jgi:hypothetical protein
VFAVQSPVGCRAVASVQVGGGVGAWGEVLAWVQGAGVEQLAVVAIVAVRALAHVARELAGGYTFAHTTRI